MKTVQQKPLETENYTLEWGDNGEILFILKENGIENESEKIKALELPFKLGLIKL